MSEERKRSNLPPWLPQYVNTWYSGTSAGANARKMNPGGRLPRDEVLKRAHPFDIVPPELVEWPEVE